MDYHRGANVEVCSLVTEPWLFPRAGIHTKLLTNIGVGKRVTFYYGLVLRIRKSFAFAQVRIARIFNTYGPRMCLDDGRVVSNFVAQV